MLSDHPELIACHLESWVRVNVLHCNRGKAALSGLFTWVKLFVDSWKQGGLQIFTMSRIDRIGKTNGGGFCAFRFWFCGQLNRSFRAEEWNVC